VPMQMVEVDAFAELVASNVPTTKSDGPWRDLRKTISICAVSSFMKVPSHPRTLQPTPSRRIRLLLLNILETMQPYLSASSLWIRLLLLNILQPAKQMNMPPRRHLLASENEGGIGGRTIQNPRDPNLRSGLPRHAVFDAGTHHPRLSRSLPPPRAVS
jgi:hypothetical protein